MEHSKKPGPDPTQSPPVARPAPGLGALQLSGQDAADFLQGQLSGDVRKLDATTAQLTSLSNPKGRLLAIAYLLAPRDGRFELLLPRPMLADVAQTLGRYVLRARVDIAETGATLPLATLSGADAHAWLARRGQDADALEPMSVVLVDGCRVLRLPGPEAQFVVCGLAAAPDTSPDEGWELARIRAGEPTVTPETAGLFVAQMVNLELLGGISFDKGCYTGQEVIARTQHLGTIKRRMFRLELPDIVAPAPGTALLSDGQRVGTVARAAVTARGAEVLAVLRIDAITARIDLDVEGVSGPARLLSLPYDIPEASA